MRRRFVLGISLVTIVGCSAITSFDNFVGDGPDLAGPDAANDSTALAEGGTDTSTPTPSDANNNANDATNNADADPTTDAGPDADAAPMDADAAAPPEDSGSQDSGPTCTIKTTGKLSAAESYSAGGTGTSWASSSQALIADGVYSTSTIGAAAESLYLIVKNFGAFVPGTAEIRGVQMFVTARGQGVDLRDRMVRLNPVNIGESQDRAKSLTLPAAAQTTSFGSPTDTWGVALTPAMVQSNQFAAGIAYRNHGGTVGTTEVDLIQIEITYCEPNN